MMSSGDREAAPANPAGSSMSEINFVTAGLFSWAFRMPARAMKLKSPNSNARGYPRIRITPKFDAFHAASRDGFLSIKWRAPRCGGGKTGWLKHFRIGLDTHSELKKG